MTTLETVLVFVGAPLAVVAVVALLVYGLGARRTPRYRPGRSFEFQPVWFLASAPRAGDAVVNTAALEGAPSRNELTSGESAESAESRRATAAARRGARRRRSADEGGSAESARSTVATRERTARKGGARGTW